MLQKKVKLLLEQLQVCIFSEIIFGVRCTLSAYNSKTSPLTPQIVISMICKMQLLQGLKNYVERAQSHLKCEKI